MKNNSKKGFTIIELLAAVVIVGIIISLAVVVINKYILQGRNTVDSQLEKQLILAAKSYYTDNKAKFITDNDNGVVVWYTTLKAENYMTNDLVDSDGNSCAKSYVVVKKDNTKYFYSGCVLCDNGGYNNTKGKEECTESLNNHIYCEWRDINNKKIGSNDMTYLGVKKNNEVSLKLYCKGNGINFRNPKTGTYLNNVTKLINDMFFSSKGTVSIPNKNFDHNNNNAGMRDFTSIVTFKASSINTFEKGSVTFRTGASYVKNKNTKINEDIYNEEITYDGIVIDGKGPSCNLTGPYKDSGLKTSVKSVKNGSTVYYGLKCNDDSNISNVDANTIKNGFESSTAISNLAVSKFVKGSNQKSFDAVVGVTVTNPNINANTKVFNLNLAFKANVVKDIFDNGNERITSKIDGKNTALSIDDQGPVCTFNGPAENALFKISKRTLNIVDDHPNDYVYYELRCTDENGINPSTFRFSDIKNNGFSKIEQSGDMNKVENNGVLIGYTYYIKAYENPNVVPNTTKATLKYNESNLSDTAGNKGQRTIESNPVIMINNNAIPSCNITHSGNNDGSVTLKGSMEDVIGLAGYIWSTSANEPDPSEYANISGTSRTVTNNVFKTGTYYLHMINELGLPGYCQVEERIVINEPKNPKIEASDGEASGDWHNKNYTLTVNGSKGDVTYYIGTSSNSIPVGSTKQVNYETEGTTYYAKACWRNNAMICSDTVQYEALLDKTPPTCKLTMRKFSGYLNNGNIPSGNDEGEYKDDHWTQYGVKISMSCSDNKNGSGLKSRQITKPGGRDDLEKWTAITSDEGDGIHKVTATAEDIAGNTFTKSVTVKRDTTPPVLKLSIAPLEKPGKSIDEGTVVKVTCTDNLSGISDDGMVAEERKVKTTSKKETLENAKGGTGELTNSKTVTFNTVGSRYLRAGCVDGALNGTWTGDRYKIDAYYNVKEVKYTKVVSVLKYYWDSPSSGGKCKPGVDCCNTSKDRVCGPKTHGTDTNHYYTNCSEIKEQQTTYSYKWEKDKYKSGKSSKKLTVDDADDWCFNNGYKASIGSCSKDCNSSNKDKTCREAYGGNKSYVVCTIKRCNEKSKTEYVGTGNYKYGASYKCLMNSKPTVTTKKNVSKEDCEAGRKEVVSNRETTITTTTCTKQ